MNERIPFCAFKDSSLKQKEKGVKDDSGKILMKTTCAEMKFATCIACDPCCLSLSLPYSSGTNDVGALKQAHVGVSILNSPELEKRANARLDVSAKAAAYQSTNLSSGSGSGFGSHSTGGASGKVASTLERLAAEQAAVAELERLDPSLVQLGDASIASPFTSRRSSVDCVLAVVRQGRCTLVTTTQVFKILALNCLVSAFMLSTLYLHGVKQVG